MTGFEPKLADGMTLAYVGDSVMELYIRRHLVESGITKPAALNDRAHQIVCAAGQAKAYRAVEELLTEEERDIFHRGRNAGHLNAPRSASIAEYRTATGFEALLGYLYLCGRNDRVTELLHIAYAL